MSECVIFGGAGFIGSHLARHLLETGRFSRVNIADIRSPQWNAEGLTSTIVDVRQPIPRSLTATSPEWIFNLAAVHREPGHQPHEYFDTNIAGARNVCAYADDVGCRNLYFSSSISVYGPTTGPTSESARACPTTPYGGSKFPAELMHEAWLARHPDRRLIICRPGVVYGPGDPGNMLRMIKAIRRGYFAYPGSPRVYKSYAYIYGLLQSIDFVMQRHEPLIIYNYVEYPTEPLGELVRHTKDFLGSRAPVLRIPIGLLSPIASMAQHFMGANSPLHPVRVRKAGMSTHIIPQTLLDMGFEFRYSYPESLKHWRSVAPQDFEL